MYNNSNKCLLKSYAIEIDNLIKTEFDNQLDIAREYDDATFILILKFKYNLQMFSSVLYEMSMCDKGRFFLISQYFETLREYNRLKPDFENRFLKKKNDKSVSRRLSDKQHSN